MKVEFGRDWSEFLSLLISHRVRFVLVGGHAVAAHGEPRLTEDLDVLVGPGVANARRLRAALAFARVWKGRVHARFHAGPLPIIGLAELIANKKAAARPKDLADVARLDVLGLGRRRRPSNKARRATRR